MPNIAIMNQPSPTCQWTDYYRYIPQTPLGSLIVTYLQSIRNQTVKPEDEYSQISTYIQCGYYYYFIFFCDCTNKTLVGSNVAHIKRPKENKRNNLTKRSDRSDVLRLGFKGNETEMSA